MARALDIYYLNKHYGFVDEKRDVFFVIASFLHRNDAKAFADAQPMGNLYFVVDHNGNKIYQKAG